VTAAAFDNRVNNFAALPSPKDSRFFFFERGGPDRILNQFVVNLCSRVFEMKDLGVLY
jgi:hypothetical protein